MGSVINFKTQIAEESGMSAFLVFANSIFEDGDEVVKLGEERINIVQLYPIYESEMILIQKIGSEAFFFNREIDFFNVKRSPIAS